MTFHTGDLTPISPDAAELIDSAQDCAKKLAECCAEKDAEIERLREDCAAIARALFAVSEASRITIPAARADIQRWAEIAREGR
jgi:hypothetical protein